MGFFSALALVLLALVGYSCGSVVGARGRVAVPGIVDLLIVLGIWVVALTTRGAFGRWLAIAVWVAAGLVIGGVLAAIRRGQYVKAESANESATRGEGALTSVWRGWKGFSRQMGNYQSRVLMGLLYFTIVLPFGLAVTLFGDPLMIRHKGDWFDVSLSNWQPKHVPVAPSLDEAGRQY